MPRHAASVLLAAILLVPIFAPPAGAQEAERTVSVSGRGEVSAAPDIAELRIAVTRRGATAAEAAAAARDAAAAVVEALTPELVAPRDLRTTGIGLFPVYDHSREGTPAEVAAYEARRDFQATVRDLDQLGAALDAATEAGANEISGLTLEIADREALATEARREAFTQARARAETLAEAAGARVGPALHIAEGAPLDPGPIPMMRMAAESMNAIAPGELTVGVTVSVVFKLEPAE